jgi:predicted ester cyclase
MVKNGEALKRCGNHEAKDYAVNEDENKKIVTRFIEEMWNQRKLQVADELFAVDCVTHQLRSGEDPTGVPRSAESVKREAAAWLTGFPDLEFVLEQMIAVGDRVVSHCTLRGTHSGAWMGIGPTGRKVNVPIITIHRIADGKIAEDWVLVGSLVLFQQLGLVPQTEEIFGAAKSDHSHTKATKI